VEVPEAVEVEGVPGGVNPRMTKNLRDLAVHTLTPLYSHPPFSSQGISVEVPEAVEVEGVPGGVNPRMTKKSA